MRIDSVETRLLRLPLLEPFRFARGALTEKETVIVALRAEGLTGYGEGAALGAPIYLPEYAAETFRVLRDFIAPAVAGGVFTTVEEFTSAYSFVRGHTFAKTAVECAFWHLLSLRERKPLWGLLGGAGGVLPVGGAVGMTPDREGSFRRIDRLVAAGCQRIKVKIGPGYDLEPLSELRNRFGDIPLMADANSAYTLGDISRLEALDDLGLLMIEQPLAYDDIVDHAMLQRRLRTPVCLDESIRSSEDARRALDLGSCRVVSIKPGRVGGLLEAKRVHDLCAARGVPVWCGGMFETSIGLFFNLSLASLPGFGFAAHVSPPAETFGCDVVTNGIAVSSGTVAVPDSLDALGIDAAAIARMTVERATTSNRVTL